MKWEVVKKSLFEAAIQLGGAILKAANVSNKCILILGAMRSGNTLLSHLLFSNPRIIGIGEAWRTYRKPSDLDRLAAKLLGFRKTGYNSNQIFQDTLLHNHLLPEPGFLKNPRVIPIFLLRKPLPVLESLYRAQIPGFTTWDEIGAYYQMRHSSLMRYAREVPGRYRIVHYEDLINSPEETLAALQRFLGLSSPFSQDYPVFNFTGRRTGDQSPHIRTGKIIEQRPQVPVFVPAEVLASCQTSHEVLVNGLSSSNN